LIDFGAAGVAHKFVIDRQIPDAVEKRSELEIAEPEAINARSLRAGERRDGPRRHRKSGAS